MDFTNVLLLINSVIFAVQGHTESATVVADLPPSSISDGGTMSSIDNCSARQNISRIEYYVYTRRNPEGTKIASLHDVDAKKRTFVLVHGFYDNSTGLFVRVLTANYLNRYDANVVAVDYGAYSLSGYIFAVCKMPLIAANFASLLCASNFKHHLNNVHVIGLSIGGQLAGLMGSSVKSKCGTIARVTGLDPALAMYQGIPGQTHLNSKSAHFVDVIHTNQAQVGYFGNLGHIDYYPNCGYIQPGCENYFENRNLSAQITFPLPFRPVLCNHLRSFSYFAESIIYNNFYAVPCPHCGLLNCVPRTNNTKDGVYMGQYTSKPQARQMYYVRTRGTSHYGLGPAGPLIDPSENSN